MLISLGFIQTMPAGENEIRYLEKFTFAQAERFGRAFEGRQLVHTVVNDSCRRQAAREIKRHRRVIPTDVIANLIIANHPVNQLLEHGSCSYFTAQTVRQVWDDDV